MATNSILKNITIRDRNYAAKLVRAIDSSEKRVVKPIDMSKKVRKATDEDLKRIFAD